MKKLLFLIAILTVTATSCRKNTPQFESSTGYFEDARFIQADSLREGEMMVRIINPWDSTTLMARYLMVNGDHAGDAETGEDATRLNLPMKRLVVFSAVHAALLCELGHVDAIVGLADAQYVKTPELKERLADGRIADLGSSTEPSLEKIMALKPDAILTSPFQNSGHGALDRTGIPVIDCADYMETTPLGRAEWSKFYAMLVEGITPTNAAMYNQVKERYTSLRNRWAEAPEKPRVITELQQRGTWMVPGGRSFAAQLIADAGGVYPFADNPSPGSLQYQYEKVLSAGENADIWLLKSLDDITLEDIAKNAKFNTRIWAYKNGGVYNANTTTTPYYEETPFHPDLLLQDYVNIFHHTGAPLRYFTPVTQ